MAKQEIPIDLILQVLPPLIESIAKLVGAVRINAGASDEVKRQLDLAVKALEVTNAAVQGVEIRDV